MLSYILRKLLYGMLVMAGVTILVFLVFQGFGDPSRLVMGQRADATTQENIRRDLNLDQPRWKQFIYYLNDVSPVSIYAADAITRKKLKGIFIGGQTKLALKFPYLRRSYQTRKDVWELLMEALPGTLLLALAAMFFAVVVGIALGVLAAVRKDTWMDGTAMFTAILGI